MLPLTASVLALEGDSVTRDPAGGVADAVRAHLHGADRAGLVILGAFGAGKSTLCSRLAAEDGPIPCTAVPLRVVARADGVEAGLRDVVGALRLEEARDGRRVLLLDGLDEAIHPAGGWPALFEEIVAAAGPRWVLTSRPGWFRTEDAVDPQQIDTLDRADVRTLVIDPLPLDLVRDELDALPGGARVATSVAGLIQLATSPCSSTSSTPPCRSSSRAGRSSPGGCSTPGSATRCRPGRTTTAPSPSSKRSRGVRSAAAGPSSPRCSVPPRSPGCRGR